MAKLVAAVLVVALQLVMISASQANALAGRVLFAKGPNSVERDAPTTALSKGSYVFEGDTINTGEKGRLQLLMVDGARISIRPETTFKVQTYQLPGETTDPIAVAAGDGKATLRLVKGAFRSVTGRIGKSHVQANYQVIAPVASSAGNMGSAFRMAYTVMGDVVNLGSRLEGQTKNYGANIIISQETEALISGFKTRELDLIRVKGKLVPITIYEPVGRSGDLPAELSREVDDYHEALALYRQQGWDDAQAIFSRLQAASPAELYALYLERIAAFRADPPGESWDGVFIATSK